jgi:hypothetical protein
MSGRIGRVGRALYEDKFRDQLEKKYHGKYVAIDVETEQAFIGDTAKDASNNAKHVNPNAIPLILGVGFDASIRGSYSMTYRQNRDRTQPR